MNVTCTIKGHDWFNEFMRASPDVTIITGVCLRCTEQRPHIMIARHWNTAGFYTYDVKEGVAFSPSEVAPHLPVKVGTNPEEKPEPTVNDDPDSKDLPYRPDSCTISAPHIPKVDSLDSKDSTPNSTDA